MKLKIRFFAMMCVLGLSVSWQLDGTMTSNVVDFIFLLSIVAGLVCLYEIIVELAERIDKLEKKDKD